MAVFELKLLSREGVPGALAKAERYRLLNQPWEAECIYRDVLAVDSDNQEATIGLVLALTDQFEGGSATIVPRAREAIQGLQDEYHRAYYAGIICERRARVLLQSARPGSGAMVYDLLSEAKGWYERAEALRPPGNDDVLLRWNACARLLLGNPQVASAAPGAFHPYSD
jgi:hypothetical protein